MRLVTTGVPNWIKRSGSRAGQLDGLRREVQELQAALANAQQRAANAIEMALAASVVWADYLPPRELQDFKTMMEEELSRIPGVRERLVARITPAGPVVPAAEASV